MLIPGNRHRIAQDRPLLQTGRLSVAGWAWTRVVCATLICLGPSIPYSTGCFPGWTIQAFSPNRRCVLWPLKQGRIFSTAARHLSERTTRPLRKRPPQRRTWTRICETNLTFINPRWQVRQGETSRLFSIQALRDAIGAIGWVDCMGDFGSTTVAHRPTLCLESIVITPSVRVSHCMECSNSRSK